MKHRRQENFTHGKIFYYTSVNVKTKIKAGKRVRPHRFPRQNFTTVVVNIYNAVEFASMQNLFVTCNDNRSSARKFNRAGK